MWLGTLNNPDTTTVEEYLRLWHTQAKATYVTGQLERGEAGTVHIQYFVYFKAQKRLGTLKKHCARSHFQGVKYNNGADDYCNKEDTRVEGPWSFGEPPLRANKKGDMAERNRRILQDGVIAAVDSGLIPLDKLVQIKRAVDLYAIMAVKPKTLDGDLQNEWHWGPTGTGKSRTVRTAYPDAFIKSNDVWWDGYQGEEVVILEEMGPKQLNHWHLLMWSDRYPFKANSKGGMMQIRPLKFIITSNYTIEECFPERQQYEPLKRRFTIHHHNNTMGF